MIKRLEQKSNFLIFDFVLDGTLSYNDSRKINLIEEFNLKNTLVDLGWIVLFSTVQSKYGVYLFENWPIIDNDIENINFFAGNVYTNLVQLGSNLYISQEDFRFLFDSGLDIKAIKIQRLGNSNEPLSQVRIKMSWRLK